MTEHCGSVCRTILKVDPLQCDEVVKDVATLPLSMGGLGLRNSGRMRVPAFWATWADCLPMMHKWHPQIAVECLRELGGMSDSPTLAEASMAARDLDGVMGFEPPSWDALLRGVRPPSQEWDQQEPACFQRGWQHEASSRVERHHRDANLFPRLSESGRALVRSQAGPGAGLVGYGFIKIRMKVVNFIKKIFIKNHFHQKPLS